SCGRFQHVLLIKRQGVAEIDVAQTYLPRSVSCAYDAAWAPTGPRMALLSSSDCEPYNNGALYVVDATQNAQSGNPVYGAQRLNLGSWAPDGQRLAVTQYPYSDVAPR